MTVEALDAHPISAGDDVLELLAMILRDRQIRRDQPWVLRRGHWVTELTLFVSSSIALLAFDHYSMVSRYLLSYFRTMYRDISRFKQRPSVSSSPTMLLSSRFLLLLNAFTISLSLSRFVIFHIKSFAPLSIYLPAQSLPASSAPHTISFSFTRAIPWFPVTRSTKPRFLL